MHAVVTGAAGFIGRHVVRTLEARGDRVTCIGRGTHIPSLTTESLAVIGSDVELIVHCAGGSSVGQSIEAPQADFQRTVPPFTTLLDHVRMHAAGARVVLVSSAAVYGDAARVPIEESAPARPISPYGEHKRMCEELCISYGRDFGVRSAVVRLFSVYGAGLRKQLLWDACRKAAAGTRRFQGTGEELRDWLNVDDAVSLLLAAGRVASADASTVNGGTGIGTTVAAVVERVFATMNAGTPEFVGGGRAGDPARYVADIARARSLGWSPRTDLTRGIGEYVAWFKASG